MNAPLDAGRVLIHVIYHEMANGLKKVWNSRHSKVKKGTKLQNIKALWLEVFLSGASLDELGRNDERKSWYGCSVTAEKIEEKKEFEITASTSP